MPITFPARLKSGPPDPPEVVAASSTILSSSTSPMWPWVVVGRMRRCEASCDMIRFNVLIAAGDFLRYIRACPGKNPFNSSGIANQHNGISRHCGLSAIVEFEDCGVGRRRRFEPLCRSEKKRRPGERSFQKWSRKKD